MFKPAILALEDGTIFTGRAFGAVTERSGEVVFNTSMMGYPEILTDPSYCGQMVCMTYPLIGNYGITQEDFESRDIFLSGLIVKENSRIASNWRSRETLDDVLRRRGIPGIEGIDTRRLVRHIRETGAMKGVLSSMVLDPEMLVEKAKASRGLVGRDCVKDVTSPSRYSWDMPIEGMEPKSRRFKVVALDLGVKYNILRMLVTMGCELVVLPATATAEEVLAENSDGVFLSNGPGDPAALPSIINEVKKLIEVKPVFGICLGHQILAQALGAKTYKLKFGHHGGNHPVMRLDTGQVEITSQNHGFAVDMDTLDESVLCKTHINLNDQTLEGMAHRKLPVFSVQYHPEAAPGPHDSTYLFEQFAKLMEAPLPAAELWEESTQVA